LVVKDRSILDVSYWPAFLRKKVVLGGIGGPSKVRKISSFLLVSALGFAVTSSAATIFTSGFSSAADQFSITTGNTVGSFTVSTGQVDLVTAAGPYEAGLCPGVSACVDLVGTPGIGGISATTSPVLTAGVTYTLDFFLFKTGRPSGTAVNGETMITLGAQTWCFSDNGAVPAGCAAASVTPNGEIALTYTPVATGAAALTFKAIDQGSPYYGDLVGAVTLTSPSAVPEPSTLLLMGMPLVALGLKKFRRA
jgi:hypothetical protein